MPLELGKCGFEPGSEGQIVHTLCTHEQAPGGVMSTRLLGRGWNARSLLQVVATSRAPKISALIDTGALITGLTNYEVACFLLGLEESESYRGWKGLDDSYRGCVFIDEKDVKKILVRATRTVLNLADCGIPLEERFCFYDQIHTTGMDIKHRQDAVAALTLGKDMVFRDYAQGAFRMRGIGKGQKIHVLVIPEIQKLIHESLTLANPRSKRPPADAVDEAQRVRDISAWLMINTAFGDILQFSALQLKDLMNIWRLHAFRNLMGEGDAEIAYTDLAGEGIQKTADVFLELVDLKICRGLPEPKSLMHVVHQMVLDAGFGGLLDEDSKKGLQRREEGESVAVSSSALEDRVFKIGNATCAAGEILARIKEMVSGEENRAVEQTLEKEEEKEQEKNKEQADEKEQEKEQEIEIEKYVDLEYTRTEEEPVPWPLESLKLDTHSRLQVTIASEADEFAGRGGCRCRDLGRFRHLTPPSPEACHIGQHGAGASGPSAPPGALDEAGGGRGRSRREPAEASPSALAGETRDLLKELRQRTDFPVKLRVDIASVPPSFYRSAEFKLNRLQCFQQLPPDLLISKNYFNPSWSGFRRVKNAIMMMEWLPGVLDARAVLPADPGADEACLRQMWQTLGKQAHSEISRWELRVLLAAAYDAEYASALRESTPYAEALQIVRSQAEVKLTMHPHRYFVLVSLAEAETLRRITHCAQAGYVLTPTQATWALKAVGDFGALDQSFGFADVQDYQQARAQSVARFFNSDTTFGQMESSASCSGPSSPALRACASASSRWSQACAAAGSRTAGAGGRWRGSSTWPATRSSSCRACAGKSCSTACAIACVAPPTTSSTCWTSTTLAPSPGSSWPTP
ncbi:unnamed protein product [Prorocentrum cordatum]|uniref:ubiquitinyl hydrolase 1 n=1 Tax=Prorocentrum cordatum TaxID=2364126 RepID=A0ABN9W870_9DINO|nr:unnamed protein product [Polarella glacialis]